MTTARGHRVQALVGVGLNLALVAFTGAVIAASLGVAG